MEILICPGMHPPALTDAFLSKLSLGNCQVFPPDRPVYSPRHLLDFFSPQDAVLIIAFSAGVVGAIAAARIWQRQGIRIAALIAIDGWGVPLFGEFPIHRVSHDYFTHWSSLMMGGNATHFYADPPVEHLILWQSPTTVKGIVKPSNAVVTAATFISEIISEIVEHYKLD
ncbi:hypothetical protein [Leptolyngbya sp. FACHB-17]|uniref:hypothetical protein n=1 Tax=unclassified Leptolyngbya TaxID=2650499 RepID=UPI00168176A8|nr:hypothetical protein [Leptolyngbya sp. FACHB-17]MBD2082271.1 hypothetical protein [Leptolyngbya sp. FACHB-17]